MKTDLEAMEAAGVDMEAVRRGWAFMNDLQEIGPEGRKNRLLFLRALAELARGTAAARLIVERLLDVVGSELPEETATFRAYYLEGGKRPSARQLARRLCMDPTTVHRHNRQVLTAMLAPVFGVDGYSGRTASGNRSRKRRETARKRHQGPERGKHPQKREKLARGPEKAKTTNRVKTAFVVEVGDKAHCNTARRL